MSDQGNRVVIPPAYPALNIAVAEAYSNNSEVIIGGSQTVDMLAASIRRDCASLSLLDKKEFLSVASDIRKMSREVEDTMLGADHPHADFSSVHQKDPFLEDIIARLKSEDVSD